MQEFQPIKMGVFKWNNMTRANMNDYPVYESDNGHYLYLWDWGQGDGINWFISDNVTSTYRGVESPDMEFKHDKCPENINIDRTPFNVYTRRRQFDLLDPRHGWRSDPGLRVECWSDQVNMTCCHTLNITASPGSPVSTWQPDKLGVYQLWGGVHGRKVWKHETRQNYVYYWEWGVNSGTEWMIGHSPYSSERGIRFNETNLSTLYFY